MIVHNLDDDSTLSSINHLASRFDGLSDVKTNEFDLNLLKLEIIFFKSYLFFFYLTPVLPEFIINNKKLLSGHLFWFNKLYGLTVIKCIYLRVPKSRL